MDMFAISEIRAKYTAHLWEDNYRAMKNNVRDKR